MRILRKLTVALMGIALAACSTTYKPAVLDKSTGFYETRTAVDPGGVTTKGKFAPKDYAAVLLVANSNTFPSRLEFVMRRTLSDLGYANVINPDEMREWMADHKFELPDNKLTGQAIKDFSAKVSPVLVIDVRYAYLGNTQHFAGLRVVDGKTLESLLIVNHPKGVWMSVDDEIIYPVLNELVKWHRRMTAAQAA